MTILGEIMGRLLLNRRGLNTKIGCQQILGKIQEENILKRYNRILSVSNEDVLVIENGHHRGE